MMLASSVGGEKGHVAVASLEEEMPSAMADVTEMIVKKATLVQQEAKEKTNLMQKAQARRRRLSQR